MSEFFPVYYICSHACPYCFSASCQAEMESVAVPGRRKRTRGNIRTRCWSTGDAHRVFLSFSRGMSILHCSAIVRPTSNSKNQMCLRPFHGFQGELTIDSGLTCPVLPTLYHELHRCPRGFIWWKSYEDSVFARMVSHFCMFL